MKNTAITYRLLLRKFATAMLITASLAAFATLGDGGKKNNTEQRSILFSRNITYNFKSFTLKSGYNYRGNTVVSSLHNNKYIMLNTTVTYQKGNNTYILPLKRKVLLDKVKFGPVTPAKY